MPDGIVANRSVLPTGTELRNEDDVLLGEEPDTEGAESEEEGDSEDDQSSEAVDETGQDSEDEEETDDSSESESDSEKPKIPFDRPTVAEIKAEFPDFFKKFPQMRESFFREIEFTKLFPTIEDAKEAFEDNEAFNVLSESALSGDPAPLLDSIEKADKKALEIFSMSFLPALMKKDNAMYSQVVTPLFQNLVRSLFADKDENTRNAGLVLAEWIFGSDGQDVAMGKKSVAKNMQLSDEQKRLKDSKDQADSTAFRTSVGHVETVIDRSLETLVLKSSSFDPDRVFSPSLRKMGAQEVIKKIKNQLASDQGHMTVMGARWKRARANGYTTDDESKIVSTYLARAKSLIPSIASKTAASMLGTKTKAADKRGERAIVHPKQNNSGSPIGSRRGQSEKNQKDYSSMTDLEILND